MSTTPKPVKRKSEIPGDLFDFITLPMLLLLMGVAFICAWSRASLSATFFHHPELNSIIVALTVWGILKVFFNNFLLFRTSLYVRMLERTESEILPTENQLNLLVRNLHGAGSLIDIQNTEVAVKRMAQKGFFIISDNDSRLIKSKIGARVRHRFGQISFFTGILISFGLLGTFVGLIQTVTSVGEQMGLVSHSLSSGKDLSVIDLITGISKPLEGMGTAFGASLFGLGGSMLLGAMNYLAGYAQDDFMEALARWLDGHIPHTKTETMAKAEKLAGTDTTAPQASIPMFPSNSGPAPQPGATNPGYSLEMGSFFVLAEDTHKQLRELGLLLSSISDALLAQQKSVQSMEHIQVEQAKQMQALQAHIAALPTTGGHIVESLKTWQAHMDKTGQAQETHLADIAKNLQDIPVATGQAAKAVGLTLYDIKALLHQQIDILSQAEQRATTTPKTPPAKSEHAGFFGLGRKNEDSAS
jgi:DNA-binding transcriptional MerR regulator